MGITDPISAFDFDAAVFIRVLKIEKDGIKETPEQELERLKREFAVVGGMYG